MAPKLFEMVQLGNHNRICGKGVVLGLFPSDSLQSQSYEIIEIAHIGPYYYGVENFVRIVWTVFVKIKKKSKNGCFFSHFWVIFGYVSHIPVLRF